MQEQTRARVPFEWAGTLNNLGNALRTLGEREGGTARLEEAIAAFREALQENILMLLAERRGDAEMAKLAVRQIEAAFTTMRDGGNAPSAAFYEALLPEARALAQKLAKR